MLTAVRILCALHWKVECIIPSAEKWQMKFWEYAMSKITSSLKNKSDVAFNLTGKPFLDYNPPWGLVRHWKLECLLM